MSQITQQKPQDRPSTLAPRALDTKNQIVVIGKMVQTSLARMKAAETPLLTAERAARLILTRIGGDSRLWGCTNASILSCIYTSIETGLEAGANSQMAYLVPYAGELKFQASYKGVLAIIRRSNKVAAVEADVVFDEDLFEAERGSGRFIKHRPDYGIDRTGENWRLIYAVAYDPEGRMLDFCVMNPAQIESYKQRSPSVKKKKASPWDTDPRPMAIKTTVRRLTTLLPLEQDVQNRIARADQDEYVDEQDAPAPKRVANDAQPKSRADETAEKIKNGGKPPARDVVDQEPAPGDETEPTTNGQTEPPVGLAPEMFEDDIPF